MFCEKCGAQIPDDAKFCDKCGSSTEPGAAPSPMAEQAVAPAAPSAFSLALKKFFSNKRNVVITAVALFLVIAAIVTIIVIACQPKKIYMDDYFHIEFYGVDGKGQARLSISEKEMKKFQKLNKQIFGDDIDEENIGNYIEPYIDMSSEELASLKNGQKIKIKLKINKEVYDETDGKYKFVLRHATVKVKGLHKPTELNLLDYIKPSFGGYNGFGKPKSDEPEVFKLINGIEARVSSNYDEMRVEFYDIKNDYQVSSISVDFDRYSKLSNDETVKVTLEADDYTDSELYNGYGIILCSQTKEYTVSGLPEPLSINMEEKIDCTFSGISSIATMELKDTSKSEDIGDYKVKFEKTGTRDFYIEILDSNGDNRQTFTYYADKHEYLKNGDKVKFETYADIEYIVSEYGIAFPQFFEIEVTGLTEPFNADPLGRGTCTIDGYNGYGNFTFTLPEDKLVYSSEDGKYTVKLTPIFTDYSYKITVVVANAAGANFLTFDYNAYPSRYLENEDKIYFTCTESQSKLRGYVEEYGIYFPYQVIYTAEGLKETTVVNPMDKLTPSFAKDGDYISMTLSLTENVITVGDYTANLSLENFDVFGHTYTKMNIEVKDKDGNSIGTGYFRFDTYRLNEGEKVYASGFVTDDDTIARSTGIVFNAKDFYIIASAK